MGKMNSALVHFFPSGILILALARWPYGYYMLLRVVVLTAALLIAGLIYQQAMSRAVLKFAQQACSVSEPMRPWRAVQGLG